MLFNTKTFPVFLVLVLLGYYLLPRKKRPTALLFASYLFYSFWNWKFVFLLALSTIVDFFCGKQIAANNGPSKKKFLYLSLATNLGILGFFKYYNFFVESAVEMCGLLGFAPSYSTLNIVLPVGISFYTFQTLSYTIDIYRGKIKPTDNLMQFALYVSFFPQLVAGPIERARTLLPQLKDLNPPTRFMVWQGILLVASGYIKKVVLSDQLAPSVDHAFSNWETLSSIYLWEGVMLFSLQIYFDFSGYSDIARGVARWFGIDLMVNFRQPYFSQNVSEFWKRWHISLSTWLKEYLYIPLGGNRQSRLKTYRNLMLTMLLGGLWHGASFTFVLWGFLHGLYLSVHKLWQEKTQSTPRFSIFNIGLTYLLVLITWVPFRAPSIEMALGFLYKMFAFTGPIDSSVFLFLGLLYVALFVIDYPIYISENEYVMMRLPKIARFSYVMITTVVVAVLILTVKEAKPFIYFQF